MIDTASQQPDALLKWMDSLADSTRLRLLGILERHELGVSDLCEVVQMPQSTVSRHLKLLGDEGWTTSRRHGTTNLYRMVLDELAPAQRKLWLLAREQTSQWATLEQDELRLVQRLRRRQQDSREFFAGAAAEWDRMRSELYGPCFGSQAALALLPEQWVIADLGCGTGATTGELARVVARVYGIDNSPEMLQAARGNTEGLANVELRQGELEAIPIEDATCDGALLVLVLTYVPDAVKVVRQMRRILKPGGRAVVVDLLRHDRDDFRRQMGQTSLGFEPAELTALLADNGFAQVRCEHLPPEAKTKGPALLRAVATATSKQRNGQT